MIIQQLQTKQINCAVYLLLTTQGQSHQSTHVSLRYNNLITFSTQFMDKEHILLGNQRCAHQLSLLRNIQQRASSASQKEECKRTNNGRQIIIIFLIGIATHKLLVNKISSSKGKQLCFSTHHVRLQ